MPAARMPTILAAVPKALPDYCQGGDWHEDVRDTKTGTGIQAVTCTFKRCQYT